MTYQTQDWQSPHHRKLWQKFYNGSGETIPAYAVMRIEDASLETAEASLVAKKPTCDREPIWMVNGPVDIPAGSYGYGTFAQHAAYVLYDDADSPAYGEMWGPKEDTWTLTKDEPGFVACGGPDGTKAFFVQRPADEIVHFELTSDKDLGTSATAHILELSGGEWAVPAEPTEITVEDWYTEPGMWQGYTEYRGLAVRRPECGSIYDIIWMETPARWIRCTATSNLTTSCTASVDHYHLQGKDPGSTVTVHDPMGVWAGWVQVDCKMWCHWNDRNKRYEITTPQLVAMFATATLTSATCGSAASIESVAYVRQGYYSADHETAPTTASNPRGHAGKAGDEVTIMAYGTSAPLNWAIVDMDLHLLTAVTNVRIDGYNFQKKTQDYYAEICSDESDWITYHTGRDCSSGSGSG